jgi:hypothetical protein
MYLLLYLCNQNKTQSNQAVLSLGFSSTLFCTLVLTWALLWSVCAVVQVRVPFQWCMYYGVHCSSMVQRVYPYNCLDLVYFLKMVCMFFRTRAPIAWEGQWLPSVPGISSFLTPCLPQQRRRKNGEAKSLIMHSFFIPLPTTVLHLSNSTKPGNQPQPRCTAIRGYSTFKAFKFGKKKTLK